MLIDCGIQQQCQSSQHLIKISFIMHFYSALKLTNFLTQFDINDLTQQIYSLTMLVPQQTYRWLASIDIVPNSGELLERKMVALPPQTLPHFESGFIIGEIIKIVFKKGGQKIPSCLENLKIDAHKNTKMTNWNFIWLSFDDLRMQFDSRIKDLILQGENALIIEIIKQLYDRDENKNQDLMEEARLIQKISTQKIQKLGKNSNKASLDIKKINLQRNPDDSQSSLQFLILLLSSSLGLNVEEILGLFTNQNKYLAHIIVKGVNEDYGGIILFYTLLNKHSEKLKNFCQNDVNDAHSCLYAIKPGFISKQQRVSQLTLKLFDTLGNIYEWFVSDVGKGATTLLLGIKRHPYLADSYWNLLLNIIKNQEINFFTIHFKQCFRDFEQMIQVCQTITPSLGQSYIRNKLTDIGVIGEWLEIAGQMFQGSLDSKLLAYSFLGEAMLWLPQSVEHNEQCLNILKVGWYDRKIFEFTTLLNEILDILQKLATNRSRFAAKIYQLIIEIFVSINSETEKKQYLVQNFSTIIPNYPKMPTHYFIEAYRDKHLHSSDFILITKAVRQNQDTEGLIKIGDVLMGMFIHNPVANSYLAHLIFGIGKKAIDQQLGQAFIKKAVKDGLHAFTAIETSKKIPQVGKPQPMYFAVKGNSEKLSQEEADSYRVKQKQSSNLIQLVDKLADLSKFISNDSLETQLREQLLDANGFLRKGTYKTGNKKLSNILRKFGISKQDQLDYDEEYRNKKALQNMEKSIAHKKVTQMNLSQLAASRVGGPEHLKKQFTDIIEKRRKQEQEKREYEQRREKSIIMKQNMIKKELQTLKLMKGFGSGQAELKEEGFWNRLLKQQEIELYPPILMQARDTEYIENLFKKYHRVVRFLFMKYTNSMYSIKTYNSFEDNQIRKQTINVVEIIKFLKDYKLFFLTNNNQIQLLVRDLNVKLLNRRQTNELDFSGFQHFLVQFCAVIYTKPHTISAVKKKGSENVKKNFLHLTHYQLLQQIFHYIKMVFAQKGQKTTMFDEPQAAYFNESEVVKEFNKKLEEDPNFILPQGYKKVTDKVITFHPKYSEKITQNLNESYLDVLQIFDEILYQSSLKIHILEPISQKTTKARVKPHAFANIKGKLNESMDGKTRVLSSLVEKKTPAIPPIKSMERKVLSFGMKLGLSYVNYKDKLLGEQVAYVIDDMLTAVENGKNSIQKQKIQNEVLKKRKQMEEWERKNEKNKEKRRKQRKQELEKMKKEATEKKQKQEEDTKEEREKKKQKQLSREKKRKEEEEKYKNQQKQKMAEKKLKDDEEKNKEKEEKKKKRENHKKAQQKFKQFNKEQVEKFQKGFDKNTEERKKISEKMEEEKKHQQQIYKKLRHKIRADDRKIIEIREKNNEEINNLYSSPQIKDTLKEFRVNLKSLFDFLIKNTYLPIGDRKHNNEIVSETWHYFNIVFQLNPLIMNAKDIHSIFRSLTKDKQVRKQYYLGLNFEEFQQGLLRIAIKHKTVFNRIADKIKDESMSEKQINDVIEKDIEEKEKNEFDQPKDINVKVLLREEDINKQIIDDYGDISKVTPQTLKGLIYYLKVPKEKKHQQERFRHILSQKLQNKYHNYDKLKQKLRQQYTLSPSKKKRNSSVIKSSENEDSPSKSKEKQ